jgi:hypothetical protein
MISAIVVDPDLVDPQITGLQNLDPYYCIKMYKKVQYSMVFNDFLPS